MNETSSQFEKCTQEQYCQLKQELAEEEQSDESVSDYIKASYFFENKISQIPDAECLSQLQINIVEICVVLGIILGTILFYNMYLRTSYKNISLLAILILFSSYVLQFLYFPTFTYVYLQYFLMGFGSTVMLPSTILYLQEFCIQKKKAIALGAFVLLLMVPIIINSFIIPLFVHDLRIL